MVRPTWFMIRFAATTTRKYIEPSTCGDASMSVSEYYDVGMTEW